MIDNDADGQYSNFRRLVAEGATTFNARADYTHTYTLPNHTCMLSGRPVSQPDGMEDTVHHGYAANLIPDPGQTLHNSGNPKLAYVASTFDVIHDHGLSTALYAGKSKFVVFDCSYDAANGAPDETGRDDGTDKIDVYRAVDDAGEIRWPDLHAAFLREMAGEPYHYCFVHYAEPDVVGHTFGWGKPAWNRAVGVVDDYLGDVLEVIESSTVLDGRTWIILTADHGGAGRSHSNAKKVESYTIPFLVWGPGVEAGADLYELNSESRTDPEDARPSYAEPGQPIRNGDSANLALQLLGLPAVPGSTINVKQDLRIGR